MVLVSFLSGGYNLHRYSDAIGVVGTMASEYKDRPSKSPGLQMFCLRKILALFEKQNGRHIQSFKDHQDALKLEILQLGS